MMTAGRSLALVYRMVRKGRRCRVKSRLSKIFVFSVYCIGPRGIVGPCGHGIAGRRHRMACGHGNLVNESDGSTVAHPNRLNIFQ